MRTLPSSRRVASTPMLRSSLSMVLTSCSCGTFSSVTGSAVSSAAHSSGSAAFLAPEMRTSPWRRRPPRISNLSIEAGSVGLGRPLGWGQRAHRERMDLVRVHSRTERGIDQLVALDRALALECGGDDDGRPMAAVAFHLHVLAWEAVGDDRAQFVGGHGGDQGYP